MSYEITRTMQVDTITGDSQLKNATGHIDVMAFSFSASKPTDLYGLGLAESGAPWLSPVSVHFRVDSATIQLKLNQLKGTTFKTVTLIHYKTDQSNNPEKFHVVTLTDAQMIDISANEVDGSLTWAYKQLKEEYFKQDTATNQLQSAGTVTFDMQTREVS
ncbi:type VI secretion system tube protein Hcp [Trinickia fusca]|uniref:type VI secretion system tube protein Hcp n=1 Tax=Trinickia fusca TaxID=2419777 RepID=UPI001FEBB64B|nr:type VI secretion system tube protein Hcp [Trinickia fusca]